MSAGLRFLFALARIFALPLSILIAVRLGYVLGPNDSYLNIFWIALMLGLVNLLVRPFVLVLLLLLSLPLFIVLRLPRVFATALVTFGLMFVTNVLMLKLVCNLLGLPLGSPWLASLTISVGSWFIGYSTAPAAQEQGGSEGQAKAARDDAIDI